MTVAEYLYLSLALVLLVPAIYLVVRIAASAYFAEKRSFHYKFMQELESEDNHNGTKK